MSISMSQVSAFMDYFQSLQRKHQYREDGNVLHYKWDMRALANQMPSGEELQMLMEFFMLFSDNKSFKYFFDTYDAYYAKMKEVEEDRLRRAYWQRKTHEALKKKESTEEIES